MISVASGLRWAATCSAGALLASGCDYSKFDEYGERAPVVSLSPLEGVGSGFGWSVSGVRRGSEVTVLVGGQPGPNRAALYNVGLDEDPVTDPAQGGFCADDHSQGCSLATRTAFVSLRDSDDKAQDCYAYAWGQSAGARNPGVLARCRDNRDFTLGAPSSVRQARQEALSEREGIAPLVLASDGGSTLLAGSPLQRSAWFYTGGKATAHELDPPGAAPESYGGQLATLALGDDAETVLFAVAAPDVGHVWLFTVDGSDATAVGCLGEERGFGRALTSGDVDGDGAFDLVIASERLVNVFSGAALLELQPSAEQGCGLSALPAGGLIASFGCGSSEAAQGCDGAEFGAALGVADLDGDGDGEVLVGAPGMQVFGSANAGAVLVYDVEGSEPHELADTMFISDAQSSDRLGASLVALPQREHDIVAVGAPGRGSAYVFYCSALLPERARMGRCSQ